MNRLVIRVSMLAAVLCMAPQAFSGPMAILSSPENLSNITVGEQVTIDVSISGLPVGTDFIFNLDTKILFPSAEFQPVPDTTSTSGLTTSYGSGSGSVFLYSSQPQAFNSTSSLNADNAIGIFNNSGSAPAISENGIYYSFTLKAIAAGTGSISFDPTAGANQYAADDTGFNYAPLPNNGSLAFTVSAVPEPSGLALGLLATLTGLTYAGYRRRKPAI